jgi:DNA adenine methylase
MTTTGKLKSPYPFFGGKRKVASIIWRGLGEISNYIEPFAGSLAVLLEKKEPCKIETVNDSDCFITNFWRAVSAEPEKVAEYADYPVHEADLHARHRWLVSRATDDFKTQMNTDPNYYNCKIAGWWVWGMGASIPGNWMRQRGLNAIPMLSSAGGGIHGMTNNILDWFKRIQERTRRTRVCCGDWSKIVTPACTYKNKGIQEPDITGVFLDPPYDLNKRVKKVYQQDNNIFSDVYKWVIDNGGNPRMKIVLCGYEGDYEFPDNWQTYKWNTNGGMANQAAADSRGKDNKFSERIWFSPHCEKICD